RGRRAGSGWSEQRHAAEHGCLAGLHVTQGLAHHLLGHAGALAALGAHAKGLAHVTVAAAALVDRVADVVVSDTSAKTDVHGRQNPVLDEVARIVMLMRTIVKAYG